MRQAPISSFPGKEIAAACSKFSKSKPFIKIFAPETAAFENGIAGYSDAFEKRKRRTLLFACQKMKNDEDD